MPFRQFTRNTRFRGGEIVIRVSASAVPPRQKLLYTTSIEWLKFIHLRNHTPCAKRWHGGGKRHGQDRLSGRTRVRIGHDLPLSHAPRTRLMVFLTWVRPEPHPAIQASP